MQLSDLLGRDVVDDERRRVGAVVDVRLRLSGDPDASYCAPTVVGLVISPHTRSSYLGYERSDVRHPVLLAKLMRWRHRDTFLALWADVARVDPDTVHLRARYRRHSPALHED